MRQALIFSIALALAAVPAAGANEPTSAVFGYGVPSPRVRAFLEDVRVTYLEPKRLRYGDLGFFEIAKLIGYAVGEAATQPGPVDVFDPAFKRELESWIALMSADHMAPHLADQAWRMIEQGARGFYDAEMETKYGRRGEETSGPISLLIWFDGLSPSNQQAYLRLFARQGLKNEDGTPYTVKQFRPLARLYDAVMDTKGLSMAERRVAVRKIYEDLIRDRAERE